MPDRLQRLYDQHIATPLARADPAHREVLFGSLIVGLILIVGTIGYVQIEGWYWQDGLYMTFITLTTIGFSEVQTLSTAGRFFTIFIAVLGIGTGGYIITRAAQLLLSAPSLRERHLQRILNRMENHFIVCGYGRIGHRLVEALIQSERDFVIIDEDPEVLEELDAASYPHVLGDAQQEETLLQAGVERAAGILLTLPDDASNVFVTLSSKEVNPDLFVISRTNHEANRSKLLHAGADKVIAPDEVGADRMAQVILRPHVDQFVEEVLHSGSLGLQMDEVRVAEGAPLAGKTLAEANFRQEFEAIVIAIRDGETGEMAFNPGPQAKVKAGDLLIVMGSQEMIRRLRQHGCQPA